MKPFYILGLLILSCVSVAEEPTWFEVELLIFSRDDNGSENWPKHIEPKQAKQALDLLSPVWMPDLTPYEAALLECGSEQWLSEPEFCSQNNFKKPAHRYPNQLPKLAYANLMGSPSSGTPYLLTQDKLAFMPQHQQIQRQRTQSVLLHTGWQMPVFDKKAAQPLHIYAGKNFADQYLNDGRQKLATHQDLLQIDWFKPLIGEQQITSPLWQLDGWIRIYLDHYLFIETELGLRREVLSPVETADGDSGEGMGVEEGTFGDTIPFDASIEPDLIPQLLTINLEQQRRVRSREIHYFDHPAMGVVIQIRRMDQPEMATDSGSEAIE